MKKLFKLTELRFRALSFENFLDFQIQAEEVISIINLEMNFKLNNILKNEVLKCH